MSTPNPFQPPASRVIDLHEPAVLVGSTRVGLAVGTALQLLMSCFWSARLYLMLVDVGVLAPIGLATLVAALACLYIGVARLVATRRSGGRLLMASLILQVATLLLWHGFFLGGLDLHSAAMPLFVPLLLAFALALWGWLAARPHARAAIEPPLQQGTPS